MAGKLLEQISADDHAKALTLSREIFLNDQAADRAAARRKGRAEGSGGRNGWKGEWRAYWKGNSAVSKKGA